MTALPDRSELRIYQKGVRDPITATLADATDERIVVVGEEQADRRLRKTEVRGSSPWAPTIIQNLKRLPVHL